VVSSNSVMLFANSVRNSQSSIVFFLPVSGETCNWSEREEYLARIVAEKWKIYHYVSLKVRLNVYLVNMKIVLYLL
jgi:hypothetical protein